MECIAAVRQAVGFLVGLPRLAAQSVSFGVGVREDGPRGLAAITELHLFVTRTVPGLGGPACGHGAEVVEAEDAVLGIGVERPP